VKVREMKRSNYEPSKYQKQLEQNYGIVNVEIASKSNKIIPKTTAKRNYLMERERAR
jgi:hypothetical protein